MKKLPLGVLFHTVCPTLTTPVHQWCAEAWQQYRAEHLQDFLNNHKLLPTLEYCLQLNNLWDSTPADIQQLIQKSRQRHGLRQLKIISQLAELDTALSEAGEEAVLLKGSALLYYPLYPSLGSRVQADIDILVATERISAIVPVLQKLGYTFQDIYQKDRHYHRHLPPLVRPQSVHIEIHRLQSESSHHIHQRIIETAEEIEGFGALRLPVATELFWHMLWHARFGIPQLRNVLDLHLLRQLYDIDELLLKQRAQEQGLEARWSMSISELQEFSQGQLSVQTIRFWEWLPSPMFLGPYIGLREFGWKYFWQPLPFQYSGIISMLLLLPFIAWRLLRFAGLIGEYLLKAPKIAIPPLIPK
jgi:hypothetical protein